MALLDVVSLIGWREYRFSPGIELLETYISDVESECAAAIAAYNASDDGFERQVGVDEQSGEDIYDWVHVHKGLRSDTWALNDIFQHYFPTLKRGAALAMLCSFVEHELNKLCEDIQGYLELGIALVDIYGNGIERASRYLRVAGNLRLPPDHPVWSQRADIFKIRNAMIHAGGQTNKEVLRIIEASAFLSIRDSEIAIEEGYLSHCISVFKLVGEVVGAALNERFKGDIKAERALALMARTK